MTTLDLPKGELRKLTIQFKFITYNEALPTLDVTLKEMRQQLVDNTDYRSMSTRDGNYKNHQFL